MSETTTTPIAQSAAPSATFAFTKLIVADLDAAVDFYARVLGLVVAQTVETADMVEKILGKAGQQGGANLILYHHKDGRRLTLGHAHGPVGFYVRDVDAAFAHAVQEGARAHREPFDAGALRVAFILDPDGHEIELVSVKR
ncbi:VOC family protein [Phenylobacterium soli]|uniref:VOC family protein n=1 Tax=Phenylobacterium soli TaxID=2170551 RepID=A0A328AIC4_9CAUL|nr:VOC family protein [Phenylobacterium soli]RAK54520.1 VOC family protein [Phenylobacterium soli]